MSKKDNPPTAGACQPADRNPTPNPPTQPDAMPLPDEQPPTDARSDQVGKGSQAATGDGGFSAPYEIGYKKPPRSGCFKKGQRANPNGRPKACKDPAEIILDEAFKEIRVRDNGRVRKISKIQVGMRKAMNSFAETGDFKAALPFLKLLVSLSAAKAKEAAIQAEALTPHEAMMLEFWEICKADPAWELD